MPDSTPNETPQMAAVADERIAWINQAVANFAATVEAISGELHAQAVAAIATLTPETAAKAKALVELQRDLQKQLNKLDYEGKIQNFIGEYDQAQKQAIATLKAMKIDTGRLGPIDDRALANLKKMDYKFLADLGPAAVAAVSAGVIRNTIMGLPKAKMIAQIQGTLSGKFVNHASTYADTALSAYDRRASMEVWKEAGLDKFKYRGPADIKTRPFCEAHVGNVYTMAEIQRMNNGTTLMPVLVYGGGWNCRHIWTPIPQVPVEKKPPASATEPEPSAAVQDALAKFAHEAGRSAIKLAKQSTLSNWAQESGQKVIEINAQAAAQQAAKAKLQDDLSSFAADAGAQVAELNKKAEAAKAEAQKAVLEQIKKLAAQKAAAEAAAKAAAEAAAKAAAEAAAKKAVEEAAAKAAAEAAAKKAAEAAAAAAAQKAAEEKALAWTAKLAAAQNPTQLIEKGTGPDGKATFTVQGKTYASSGAAWNFAKKLFNAAHPEAAAPKPAVAPKPAPAPSPAPAPPKPTAPAPEGMLAQYKTPAGDFTQKTYTYNPITGKYKSDDGLEALPANVKTWAQKGWLEPASPEPAAAPASATPKTAPPAVPPVSHFGKTPAEFGEQFTFEKAADVGGIHYKEFYRDAQGNRWLFKPVLNPTDKFMVYADEAAFKVQKAIRGDVVEVRAAEINGKFGSIQKMETDLAKQPDFAQPGRPGKPMDLAKATASDIAQLQQEQVVDWLLSNHDSHASQFIRTKHGTVYGIDKTQSWKWLGKDQLNPTYWPNEHEPIYNQLWRQAKAGEIQLDPAAAFKAIKAAEAITDAELIGMVRPYAEERFKSNPAGLKQFYDTLVARKNGIRADFEKVYADILGKPDFKFAPPPPPTPKEAAAQPAPAAFPRLANAGNVDAANDVQNARSQGRTLRLDSEQIEDQNVHAFHQLNAGKSETVLRFKLTTEGEKAFLQGLGPLPAPKGGSSSYSYEAAVLPISKIGPGKGWQFEDAKGKKHKITAKGVFDTLINGDEPTSWAFGWSGGPALTAQQIKDAKAEAALYLSELKKKEQQLKPKTAASLKQKAAEMTITVGAVTQDTRRLDPDTKEIHIKEHDVDFARLGGTGTKNDQMVSVDFKDGARIRYVRSALVGSAAYALQSTFEMTAPGKLDAAGIEKMLERLGGLGVKAQASTPVDEEWMYLAKHAYYNQIHESLGWKKVTAITDPEARVAAGRKFWSDRMGKDVTKLKDYNPAGEEDLSILDPTKRAGKRRFFRFDFSDADFEKATKGMALGHAVVSGTLDDMITNKVLRSSGYIASRMERIRMGMTLEGGSPGMDIEGGGASYLYTSLRNAASPGRIMGEPLTIFFKKKLMRRLDSAHFSGDNMGRANPLNIPNRSKTPADAAAREGGSNEWLFKDGFNFLEWVDYIKPAPTGLSKQDIVQAFKKAGVTRLPDGRRVEDIVK